MSYHDRIVDVDPKQFDHGLEEYHQGWQAADQYAYEVLWGKLKRSTNVHTKNACARYVYDRACRTDLDFRTEEIDDVIRFTNTLRHVKGPLARKPMYLMMWMIFTFANLYGWYYNEGNRKDKRRFTKALTLVARGNAKSTLCSVLSLYNIATSPNGSPAVFTVARNQKQAAIIFDDAMKMLKAAPAEIRMFFKVKASEIHHLLTEGKFEAMPADAESLDGLRVALGICDELHTHRSSDLLDTLSNGTSATVDSLIYSISTAGIRLDGVCIQERNMLRDVNEGIEEADHYFGVEYSIDEFDEWDDDRCWIKANPSLHHAMPIEKLRDEMVGAKRSAQGIATFKTKHCDLFVNTNANPYIDVNEMQKMCGREDLDMRDYFGRECWLGLDLAQTFDLAALSFIFPEDDGTLTAIQKHYFPTGSLSKLPVSKYEYYINWEDDGWLTLTEGNATDFEFIKDDIRWAAEMFDLHMVGYDPYAGAQLAMELEKEGINMVEVRQNYANMSEPAKLLQKLISEGKFNYQIDDKCFEWCMANSVTSVNQGECIMVHKAKDKPHDKVDSVIALITGLSLATLKEPKPKSPYKKRGLVTL